MLFLRGPLSWVSLFLALKFSLPALSFGVWSALVSCHSLVSVIVTLVGSSTLFPFLLVLFVLSCFMTVVTMAWKWNLSIGLASHWCAGHFCGMTLFYCIMVSNLVCNDGHF